MLTWHNVQRIKACLPLFGQLLQIQLYISALHRVHSHQNQFTSPGVRPCKRKASHQQDTMGTNKARNPS